MASLRQKSKLLLTKSSMLPINVVTKDNLKIPTFHIILSVKISPPTNMIERLKQTILSHSTLVLRDSPNLLPYFGE